MLPVLHLDPVLRSPATVRPIGAFRNQALEPHVAGRAEEIGSDLGVFEVGEEMPSGRRDSRRCKFALRIESGSFRKSSPSIARTSNAISSSLAASGEERLISFSLREALLRLNEIPAEPGSFWN